MLWIIAVLVTAVAATTGLILVRRKRPRKSLISRRIARKLVKVGPNAVSAAILNGDTGGREETSIVVGFRGEQRRGCSAHHDARYRRQQGDGQGSILSWGPGPGQLRSRRQALPDGDGSDGDGSRCGVHTADESDSRGGRSAGLGDRFQRRRSAPSGQQKAHRVPLGPEGG